jgi:hypothetical protein
VDYYHATIGHERDSITRVTEFPQGHLAAIQHSSIELGHGPVILSQPGPEPGQFLSPAELVFAVENVEHWLLSSNNDLMGD